VTLLVLMQTGGKVGPDLSINNLFRRIFIKFVYERGPEFSGPLLFLYDHVRVARKIND